MVTVKLLFTLNSSFFIFYYLLLSLHFNHGISQNQAPVSQHSGINPEIKDLSVYMDQTNKQADKFKLFHHSFESPLSRDYTANGLFDWYFDDACVPTKKNVILTPAVPNRQGQLWHRKPLETDNLEILFSFNIIKEDSNNKDTQNNDSLPLGFAFWYSMDEYKPNNTPQPLNASLAEMKMMGTKPYFDGLGIIFKTTNLQGIFEPQITVVSMNSSGQPTLLSQPFSYDFVNTNGEMVIFYLAALPFGILGQIRTPSQKWKTIFQIDYSFKSGGFIGFSSDSGKDQPSMPYQIAIYSVLTYNLDPSNKGEQNPDLGQINSNTAMNDLINKYSPFKDQHEMIDSVRSLSRTIYQQISEQASRESEILRTVRSLTLKSQYIEHALNEINTSLAFFFEKNSNITIDNFRSELHTMKNLLNQHSQLQNTTIGFISSKLDDTEASRVDELKRLLDDSKTLQASIHSSHSLTFYMTFLLMFCVIFFGLFMWKRFRDMEKKHYL